MNIYFPDLITTDKQIEIVNGLKSFLSNGNFYSLPIPDRANGSGKFKEIAKKINENIKQSPLYRLADRPMGARQHSEEVMRDSIDKMSDIFGVKAEYVYDAKDTNKKGWYDPKDGKV